MAGFTVAPERSASGSAHRRSFALLRGDSERLCQQEPILAVCEVSRVLVTHVHAHS